MSKTFEVDPSAPVMVTGATGYVAGWIVKDLLEAGVTVHATVRDPDNRKKVAHLDEIAASAPGTLKYFRADLLEDGAFAEAMEGCRIVFHTASPFTTKITDPQKDLVDPALLGTRNVLKSVDATDDVERVVLTSSIVATFGDNVDIAAAPGGVLTEEQWNTTSSLDHQPYPYSKTLAEREAWKIADAQSRWRLVTINPTLVIGPGLNPNATSESFRLIRQFGNGTAKIGVPHVELGLVDVRDVAQAHLAAAYLPDAEGRHIVSGHDSSLRQIADILRPEFGDRYPIPNRELFKWTTWLVGPLVEKSLTRKYVSLNVGHPFRASNEKSRRQLGITYRPLEESLTEFFQQMIDNGDFAR